MSAVSNEIRMTGNAKTSFIEKNKNMLENVSRLNFKRAQQISQQFQEQRKVVFEHLNGDGQFNKQKLNLRGSFSKE